VIYIYIYIYIYITLKLVTQSSISYKQTPYLTNILVRVAIKKQN